MNEVKKTWMPVKIWPYVAVGLILLAGGLFMGITQGTGGLKNMSV